MYFVGNAETISKSNKWKNLISQMEEAKCLGTGLEAVCPAHPLTSVHKFSSAQSIISMIEKPNTFCQVECRTLMPCQKPEHQCTKTCFPKHGHSKCLRPVFDSFPVCGHPVMRKCWEELSKMKCMVDTQIMLSKCGHGMTKKCHQSEDQVNCTSPCPRLNDCRLHNCKQVCGESHGHSICNDLIDFRFPGCNHPSPKKKKCTVQITWKCKNTEKI